MTKKIKRDDAPFIFALHVWRGFIGGVLTNVTTRVGKKAIQSPHAAFFEWTAALLECNPGLKEILLAPIIYRKDELEPEPLDYFQQEILCYFSLLGRRITATNSLLGDKLADSNRFTAAQVFLLELLRASAANGAWNSAELVRLPNPVKDYGTDACFAEVGDKLEKFLHEEIQRKYLKNSASPTLIQRYGVAHIRIDEKITPIPEELSLFDVLSCISLPLTDDIVSSDAAWAALQNLIFTLNRPYANRVRTGLPFDAHFTWMALASDAAADENDEDDVEDVGCGVGIRLSDVKCRTIGNLRKEIVKTYGRGRINAETVRAVWPKVIAEQKKAGQSDGYRGDVEKFLEIREGRLFVDQKLIHFTSHSLQNSDEEVKFVPAYAHAASPYGGGALADAGAPGSLPTNDPNYDPSTDEDTPAWDGWLAKHGSRLTKAERLWIELKRDDALGIPSKQAVLADAVSKEHPYSLLPEPMRTTAFEFFRDRLISRIKGLTLRPKGEFMTEPEKRLAELEATRPKQETDDAFWDRVRRDNMLVDSLWEAAPYAEIAKIADIDTAFAVLVYFYWRDMRQSSPRPAFLKRS